jgi:DNA polymerase elongation subunit (family B)
MLDDFTRMRDEYRKQLAVEKDPEKRRLLDIKQEVVKVLSNAVYGAFGYRSRKHNLEVAEAVTAFGQRMIKFAGEVAEELGMQVIYGDTDSVFVATGANNYGEAYNAGLRLQDEIMRRIPKYIRQFHVSPSEKCLFEIKLEKVYSKFFMGAQKGKAVKKRYCGYVLEKDGSHLDVKGFDIRRSDTSEFATKLQRKLIETLLKGKEKEKVLEEIANELNRITEVPLVEIGVPSAITKPLNEYKSNAVQKKAAENANKYLNTKYKYGSKPLRLYIIPPQPEELYPKLAKRSEAERDALAEELQKLDVIAFDETIELPKWVKVDYKRMLALTVKPKIERFLEALEITWEELQKYLKPELRIEKKRKRKEIPLDVFFGGKTSA